MVLALDVHILLIQESWLDESVEQIDLPGYVVISLRDRHESENRGGVVGFCRRDVKNFVLWSKSEHASDAGILCNVILGI